jgi:DNA-binding CsgD family transcriptional regulator
MRYLTLTPREIEVLWLIAEGHSNKIIADKLGLSAHTAKFHVANAVTKMGSRSRTKAAVDFVLWQGQTAVQRIEPSAPNTQYAKMRNGVLEALERNAVVDMAA